MALNFALFGTQRWYNYHDYSHKASKFILQSIYIFHSWPSVMNLAVIIMILLCNFVPNLLKSSSSPSVTCYKLHFSSVQSGMLHVTEHPVKMVQYICFTTLLSCMT